jgi:Asp-tRNA(Asn)/Glu-tRNA(Gln) amidotransferase A subunit family amidase
LPWTAGEARDKRHGGVAEDVLRITSGAQYTFPLNLAKIPSISVPTGMVTHSETKAEVPTAVQLFCVNDNQETT